MRIFPLGLTVFLVLAASGCARTAYRGLASFGPRGKIYEISGFSSKYGAYLGYLQILPRDRDEGVLVTRMVDYRNYRFEEMKVQEVWQGEGEWENGVLHATFLLKRADVFNTMDDSARTPEQYLEPQTVDYLADESHASFGGQIENLAKGEEISAEEEPLWQDQRKNLVSQGNSHPTLGAAAMASVFAPVVLAYQKDEFVRGYANRPEVKSKNQYFVFDPTDFEFLRNHPDAIRLANKVMDPISLVEASMRRDAYAPTLAEKATVFDRDFAENHLNEFGLYADAVFDAGGERSGFSPSGDSCLWTGMYAGSQAMRWLVSKDPVALENFQRALRGILLLLDVTGNEAEFARTAARHTEGETLGAEWKRGTGVYSHVKYLEGGNNDMAKGIFYAFAWANEILPEGDPLRKEVAAHSLRLPKLRVAQELKHFGNRFTAAGLAAIAGGKPEQYHDFLAVFALSLKPTNDLWLNQGFYYGGIADWSGVNLSMVAQVAQILVAKQAANKFFGDNPTYGDSYVLRQVRQNLMNTWGVYANARRGFLTVATHTFAVENSLGFPAAGATESFPQLERWAPELEQAVWLLREVPAIRHPHSLSFDFTLRPDWSLSAWPLRPWKYWNESGPMSRFYQGAYEFPIFESKATTTENYWKDAFEYRGASSANARSGRVDYLTTYWMGRLGGLLREGS